MSADRSAVRVTGPVGGFRRGGFAFGAEAVVIALSALSVVQLLRILREPVLTVEGTVNGEDWFVLDASFPAEELAVLETIAAADQMSVVEMRRRLESGELELDETLLEAMRKREAEAAPAPASAGSPPAEEVTALQRELIDANTALAAERQRAAERDEEVRDLRKSLHARDAENATLKKDLAELQAKLVPKKSKTEQPKPAPSISPA